jgi:hypothetical protein
MPRQSIVDSPDIGDKLRELQRREGRLPLESVHPETGLHPLINAPKGFPQFLPLQDAPREHDGIVLYLQHNEWQCRQKFRHCRSCGFPNDFDCCLGRSVKIAYWASSR